MAKTANVSVATVSRVLSGSSHPVSKETRARVLDAARELNYSPSALAKAMVTHDTHIVGVIIGDAIDPYFAAITRGVEDQARQYGYLVIVCNSDREPDIELQYLATLNEYRVDGVIFAGGGLVDDEYVAGIEEALAVYYEREAVCVSLGKHLFPSFSVMVDNTQISADGVEYLIGLGHREIAYISGPPLLTTTQLRVNGYEAAMRAHDLPIRPEFILNGSYKYEAGVEAARTIASLRPRPTAVMVSNDVMAIGCLAGLKELGIRVPDEISVMGVDDVQMSQFVDPPLSTVAIPLLEMGATGMESLIKLRNGELTYDQSITLPHRVIARKSTAPPRPGAKPATP